MLHEIAPRQFHIEWKNIQPEPEDRIIFAYDGRIYAAAGEEVRFPTCQEMDNWYYRQFIRPDSGQYTYLFSIDDERYFTFVYDEDRFRAH